MTIIDRWWPASLLVVAACAGCAQWQQGTANGTGPAEAGLPAPRMSADSVVLETVVLRVRWPDPRFGDSLWQEIDEQAIPLEVRQALRDNGFRCGIVPMHLPAAIRDQLNEVAQVEPDNIAPAVSPQGRYQRRPGQSLELVGPITYAELPVLVREGARIHGRTYNNVQCILEVKAYPSGDGHARLEVLPFVRHGEPKRRFVPNDDTSMLRLEVAAERAIFPSLLSSVSLAPGESLVMTCIEDACGLGKSFFIDNTLGQPQQRLVLVRLAHTQSEDLFSAEPLLDVP